MYATKQDILDLYGEDALYAVADRDGDDSLDDAAIDKALNMASSEIDTYVGSRHTLPLPVVPEILTQYAVDLALYRLSGERATEERVRRFDAAISSLRRIASGDQTLPLPQPVKRSPKPVLHQGSKRLFTRETMKGL